MNKNTVIGIVVIIIVIIAGYFLLKAHTASAPTGDLKPAEAAPSGTNTSDAALDQDSAAIDAQMNGFASDNATVDGSMNDTPVSQ